MARTWTKSQEAAMNDYQKTVLVSAAAGSGKTSVLTERIIRSITDPARNGDLSRMLIVTFTRAAAGEMKGRIAAALSEAMAANPNDERLQRQLFLLGSAQISTIDSFFQRAVRSNFEQLNIPASFRIADESEIAPLSNEILDGLIEEYYHRYDPKDSDGFSAIRRNPFACALDHLLSNRSDGLLNQALLDFQRSFASYPEGIKLLSDSAKQLRLDAKKDFFQSSYGAAIREHLIDQFRRYSAILTDFDQQIAFYPIVYGKASGLLSSDLTYCQCLLEALEKSDYEEASISATFFIRGTFPNVKDKPAELANYQTWRAKFKTEVEKVQEYLRWTPEMISAQMLETASFCEILYDFFREYQARLLTEKKSRGILEYDDVRAMLYRLLNNPDGSPSEFAKSLSAQYDAVYIDEYQDVDFMQDRIFARIGENCRFMVGDIKQSIYRFRGSEPSIFSNYRRAFPLFNDAAANSAKGICVFMSENFRCSRPVIDFTNRVCDFLFSACEQSVGYRPEDDLICSKPAVDNPLPEHPAPVEVHVFDCPPRRSKDEKKELEESEIQEEALWTAQEIQRLLREERLENGNPITPADIAILVRYKNHGKAYADALESLHIPVASAASKNLFDEALMVDIRNLLRAIDNPYRDLPLSEFLLSPLSEYTLEELSHIRSLSDPSRSLFDSMQALANSPSSEDALSEKCAKTVDWLNRLHTLSTEEPADHLLRTLYLEDFLKPYTKDSVLLYLYEQARTYQRTSWCGLYGFLDHLDDVAKSGNVSAEGFRKAEKAVTIMTVHHSKGLEFPVVFFASCGSSFNRKDSRKSLLYHREIGCGTKLYDPETGESNDTALRASVILATSNEQAEENIRSLYVALTRARERLYVSGTLRAARDTAMKNATLIHAGDRNAILRCDNPLSWILAALSAPSRISVAYDHLFFHHPCTSSAEWTSQQTPGTEAQQTPLPSTPIAPPSQTTGTLGRYADTLAKKEAFIYPRAFLEGLPVIAAASKLSPSLLDLLVDEEDNEAALDAQIRLMESAERSFDSFLLKSKKPSAAEIGTATHLFLEFCDYALLLENGVDAECERLLSMGFIGERTAELLNRTQLEAFRKSRLMDWISKAKQVHREKTFRIFLPMSSFTQDPERKELLRDQNLFVQGSIDCLLSMDDGRLLLIDYKTDALTDAELRDPKLASQMLGSRHLSQLKCYAQAVQQLYGRAPDEIYIYSLPFGDLLPISL